MIESQLDRVRYPKKGVSRAHCRLAYCKLKRVKFATSLTHFSHFSSRILIVQSSDLDQTLMHAYFYTSWKMQINFDPRATTSNAISTSPANAMELDHQHNVPPDLLSTLLTSISDLKSSVKTLQDSVSKLQNENMGLREELRSTKTDLMILRENSGVRFPQFSRLPAELRR